MTATVTLSQRELFIRFGAVTHFRADRREIIAYQSWEQTKGRDTPIYRIEFYMRHGSEITLEYAKRKHWRAVLAALDRVNMMDDDG